MPEADGCSVQPAIAVSEPIRPSSALRCFCSAVCCPFRSSSTAVCRAVRTAAVRAAGSLPAGNFCHFTPSPAPPQTSTVCQSNTPMFRSSLLECDCICLQGGPNAGGPDAFMTGLAGNMLRQSGENYFQRGQAFMQSKMGFMSTDSLHYYYNLNAEYGASSMRTIDVRCVSACSACCARCPSMRADACTLNVQCARSC